MNGNFAIGQVSGCEPGALEVSLFHIAVQGQINLFLEIMAGTVSVEALVIYFDVVIRLQSIGDLFAEGRSRRFGDMEKGPVVRLKRGPIKVVERKLEYSLLFEKIGQQHASDLCSIA